MTTPTAAPTSTGRSARRALCIALATVAAVSACDACDPAAEPTGTGSSPTRPPAATVDETAERGSDEAASPQPTIGIEVLQTGRHATDAVVTNRAALLAHREGRYEASRDGFAAALAADPRYDLARFNLACAHARLGDHDAAARELGVLLERDLPRFLRRAREDADLETLRASPQGAALLAGVPGLEAAWEDAIARGLPAMYEGRHGFYLREQGRFVPAIADDVAYGVMDLARMRVAYIDAHWSGGEIEADEAWSVYGAGVASFGAEGAALTWTAEYPIHPAPSPAELLRAIDPSAKEVRFDLVELGQWGVIRAGRLARATSQRPAAPRENERPPEGFAVQGNALHVPGSPEPIELGSGHGASRWHSFAISPDGSQLAVASERETEPEPIAFEEHASVHRTFVDHVDLRTRRVTRLSVEPGGGFVVEHGGDLYVAVESGPSRRYVAFSPAAPEDLPPSLAPSPVFGALSP